MNASDLICDAARSALLVIDIQERLSSAMPEKVLEKITQNTGRLIQAANMLDVPVIATEQYPKGLGATLEPLSAHLQNPALSKTCFSSCSADNFKPALAQYVRKQIIITGMESHVCVTQSSLELQHEGYQVFVVEDAVCSRNKHHHRNAMARLQQAGIIICNHESVMFEWLRDAKHPQFKNVTALIK